MLVKKRLESDLHAKAEAVEKLHNDGAKMFWLVQTTGKLVNKTFPT